MVGSKLYEVNEDELVRMLSIHTASNGVFL